MVSFFKRTQWVAGDSVRKVHCILYCIVVILFSNTC